MKVNFTAQDLIDFEEDIGQCFADKKILAPIHLDNGNENQLIEIFEKYVEHDSWICCSWRSHYKSLLKGVPPELMKEEILKGKSISLCFPEYKVISSAIVGGIIPIALGLAFSIKMKAGTNKVICFMGEMTSETGVVHECIKYSENHNLPILWVIEDNGKSVCTLTREVWGTSELTYEIKRSDKVIYYKYESRYPHAGKGARIQF